MAVSAIPKGCGVWCRHASRSGQGCKVYDDRPAACREWSCAWLNGHGAFQDSDRPDLIGVVASVTGRGEISLHEEREGALGENPGLLGRLVESGETVTSIPLDGRPSVIGVAAAEVRRRMARMERQRL